MMKNNFTFMMLIRVVVFSVPFCFCSIGLKAQDVTLRKVEARVRGVDGLFSLSNYSSTLIPISTNPIDFSKPLFQINSEFLLDGDKKIFFKNFFGDKNKTSDLENSEMTILNEYPIILGTSRNFVFIKFESFDNGLLALNYKGKTLYLKPDEKIETTNPGTFYFAHLFYKKSENDELDKELLKVPLFTQLIRELQACTKDKNEDCFAKYLYTSPNDKVDPSELNARIRNMKNIFTRAHIESNPKANEYYKKTRRQEEDTHIPDGIEKMIDRKKSPVWNWFNELLSLKLNDDYYINFKSDNLQEGINGINIHLKNSSVVLYFKKNKSDMKWYIDDMQLTVEYEGIRSP